MGEMRNSEAAFPWLLIILAILLAFSFLECGSRTSEQIIDFQFSYGDFSRSDGIFDTLYVDAIKNSDWNSADASSLLEAMKVQLSKLPIRVEIRTDFLKEPRKVRFLLIIDDQNTVVI